MIHLHRTPETLAMNKPPRSQQPLAHTTNGPAIHTYPQPPPSPHNHFGCCDVIIICLLFIFFMICIALFINWLSFNPQQMQIAVTSASLSRFNLTSPSTGDSFDFTTNLQFRNPNKRASIYYDWVEAKATYDGMQCTCMVVLPNFHQGFKETTEVPLVLEGCSMIGKCGGGGGIERVNATGIFLVDLWIFGKVRYKFRLVVPEHNAFKAFCPLRVSLGKAEFSFTDCRVYIDDSFCG